MEESSLLGDALRRKGKQLDMWNKTGIRKVRNGLYVEKKGEW
jgi:hypothetical protein